jgi:hypothetical protein
MNKMNIEQELSVLKQCIIDQEEILKVLGEQIKHLHIEFRKIRDVLPPVDDFGAGLVED